MTTLSTTYDQALLYTSTVHNDHLRKGTQIPYLSHLMAVSALVLEGGGDEAAAIAGLLHDAPEDRGGQARLDDIRARFGDRVAEIVRRCCDSLVEGETKAPWQERKAAYLTHLAATDPADPLEADYLLVTTADKLHNAQAILRDFRSYHARGEAPAFWARFTGKGGKTTAEIIGYYQALAETLERLLAGAAPERRALAREFVETVGRLVRETGVVPDRGWQSLGDVEKRNRIAKALRELREIRDSSPLGEKDTVAKARKGIREQSAGTSRVLDLVHRARPESTMARPISLDRMSVEEKLQAMESLWDDLCQRAGGVVSPDWHQDVLIERQRRYQSGGETVMDWEAAKLEIRDKLK